MLIITILVIVGLLIMFEPQLDKANGDLILWFNFEGTRKFIYLIRKQ